MKTLKLSNGFKNNNGDHGFRRIVLDPQGNPRPVQSVVNKGLTGNRCTYQVAHDWDLIISHSYKPSKFEIHILMDGELSLYKGFEPSTIVDIQYRLKELPGVFTWLTREAGESYLPDGIGWTDGVTQAEINKNARICAFLKGIPENVLDQYLGLAKYSPHTGMPMDWKQAGKLPTYLDSHAEFFEGNLASVCQSTEWILYHRHGEVTHSVFEPTSGEWLYADRRLGHGDYNADPVKTPDSVVRAIKVTKEPYRRDCSSYGIKWELFSK